MSPKKARGRNYVDAERLEVLALEAAEDGEVCDELVEMFYRLAHACFDSYRHKKGNSYVLMERDDAVQEAVIACWKAVTELNTARGSALNLFWQTIKVRYRNLFEFCSRKKRDPGKPIYDIDRLRFHDVPEDGICGAAHHRWDAHTRREFLEPTECQRLRQLKIESDRNERGRRTSQFSVTQINDIVEAHAGGEGREALARRYGVSIRTINRTLRRAREAREE